MDNRRILLGRLKGEFDTDIDLDLQLSLKTGRLTKNKKSDNIMTRFWEDNYIPSFHNRTDMFKKSLFEASKINGLYTEFGVLTGGTINTISSIIPDKIVYGFDSWKGFQEDYGANIKKGDWKYDIPTVNKNIKLIIGYFQNTLEPFLEDMNENMAFIHMDADLYSSTKYVLNTLAKNNRIQKGAVLQFDEFFERMEFEGYVYWYTHEFDAWNEFVKDYNVNFTWLGSQSTCCSMIVNSIDHMKDG